MVFHDVDARAASTARVPAHPMPPGPPLPSRSTDRPRLLSPHSRDFVQHDVCARDHAGDVNRRPSAGRKRLFVSPDFDDLRAARLVRFTPTQVPTRRWNRHAKEGAGPDGPASHGSSPSLLGPPFVSALDAVKTRLLPLTSRRAPRPSTWPDFRRAARRPASPVSRRAARPSASPASRRAARPTASPFSVHAVEHHWRPCAKRPPNQKLQQTRDKESAGLACTSPRCCREVVTGLERGVVSV